MCSKKTIVSIGLFLLLVLQSQAQENDYWTTKKLDSCIIDKLNLSKNNLNNTNSLFPLLSKLYRIKHFSNEKAVIVHLGDSHIQADMMTSVIRTEMQSFFGNAGRGLIFPYQVIKSNAPVDLISNSKSSWKGNRITKADTTIACGISGFGMQSCTINPEFNFEFRTIDNKKETFDKIDFFMGGKVSEMQLDYNESQYESMCFPKATDFTSVCLKSMSSGFKLSFPTLDTIQFYGASLEKKDVGGVLYHSIGANGAKFSDYNKTPLFWKQIEQLHADCYVISLGTNEAQDPNIAPLDFIAQVRTTVDHLKAISPNACIIISTPPVSYFKKSKPNASLATITNAVIDYCEQNNLVYWDLFNVSNGLNGASSWKALQLLRGDLVHFSKEGYVLQGNLFVAAFAKVWNDFLSKKINAH